jgi:hypothetical protein
MARRLVVCTLFLGLLGCGDQDEIAELTGYVKAIQKFNHYNQQVEGYIVQFDDPTFEKTKSRINAARQLIDDYAAAVNGIGDIEKSDLRNTHKLYSRSFDQAKILARDLTGDLNRQAHSVVIGLRQLRTIIRDRVYPSIEVLLARKKFSYEKGSEYGLPWGNE